MEGTASQIWKVAVNILNKVSDIQHGIIQNTGSFPCLQFDAAHLGLGGPLPCLPCQTLDFYVPLVSITKVQKGVYYSGITLFNYLPPNIKEVAHDIKKFKHKLRKFLIYSLLFILFSDNPL
jgi:hypothetical protein